MADDRAIQEALQELVDEVKNISKVLQSTTKTVIRDTKKLEQTRKMTNITMKDYFNTLEDGTTKMALFKQEIKESIPSIEKMKNKMAAIPGPGGLIIKAFKFIAKTVMAVGTAMIKTALAFSDVTKSIDGLEDMVDAGFGDIPLVGPLMKEFGKEIDANVGHFKSLAKQGASFGSSIVELRNLQGQSTIPLEKFTGLIGGNSEMLAKLYGTVDQGVPRIAALTGKLRDITEKEFAQFGLTLDETSEYMMTYQNLERARGNTQRMTNAQLVQGTQKYTKNLITLSKLTGKNVDELNKQNDAMAADGVFQSQLAGMSADRAKTLNLGIGQLEGPLQQLGKEFIGLGAPISDTSRELEAMSGGRFGEAFKKFKADGDLVSFQNSLRTISADVMANSKNFGQAALAGGGFTEALNAMAKMAGVAMDPETLQTEEMASASKDNIENLVNLNSVLDRTKTAFEQARFDVLTPLIYKNSDAVTKTTARINDGFKKLANEGIPNMVKKMEKIAGSFSGGDKDTTETTTGKSKKKWWQFWKDDDDSGATTEPAMMQHGTGGVYKDFGAGTPAVLHGEEAVLPKGDDVAKAKLTGDGGIGIGDFAKSALAGGGFANALKGIVDSMQGKAQQKMKEMIAFGTTISDKAKGALGTGTATAGISETPPGQNELATISKDILESSVNIESHLNKLVTINMMTEKNTKNTNKELADMGGSIV